MYSYIESKQKRTHQKSGCAESREQVCGDCAEPYTSCTPCIHLSRECEGVWEVCWGDVKGTRVGAKGTRVRGSG